MSKLEERRLEIQRTLIKFLDSDDTIKRHGDLIKKLRAELEEIESQLELKQHLKDTVPEEVEEMPKDSTLMKLAKEFADAQRSMELLKANGRNFDNTFRKLEDLDEAISKRLKVIKDSGQDGLSMLPKEVREYRSKFHSAKKALAEKLLEEKKATTKLTDAEVKSLNKSAMDMVAEMEAVVSEGSDAGSDGGGEGE